MRASGCATGGPVSPNERGSACLSASVGSPRSLGQRPWRSAWFLGSGLFGGQGHGRRVPVARSASAFCSSAVAGLTAFQARIDPGHVLGSVRATRGRRPSSPIDRVRRYSRSDEDGFWDLGFLGLLIGARRNAPVRDRDLSAPRRYRVRGAAPARGRIRGPPVPRRSSRTSPFSSSAGPPLASCSVGSCSASRRSASTGPPRTPARPEPTSARARASWAAIAARTHGARASSTDRTLTWRTRLPVPSIRPSGFGRSAPSASCRFTWALCGMIANEKSRIERPVPIASSPSAGVERLDAAGEAFEHDQAQRPRRLGDRRRAGLEIAIEGDRVVASSPDDEVDELAASRHDDPVRGSFRRGSP